MQSLIRHYVANFVIFQKMIMIIRLLINCGFLKNFKGKTKKRACNNLWYIFTKLLMLPSQLAISSLYYVYDVGVPSTFHHITDQRAVYKKLKQQSTFFSCLRPPPGIYK